MIALCCGWVFAYRCNTPRTNRRCGRQTDACPQITYQRLHAGANRRKQAKAGESRCKQSASRAQAERKQGASKAQAKRKQSASKARAERKQSASRRNIKRRPRQCLRPRARQQSNRDEGREMTALETFDSNEGTSERKTPPSYQ